MKYSEKLRKEFEGKPFFTSRDAKRLFRQIGKGYLNLLLYNMLKRNEIFRLGKGAYSFSSDIQLAGFVFQPFYYGCENALSIHNLWEQATNPVIFTPRKVRNGIRSFYGNNYLVRRISRRMFFGYETAKYGNFWIPVSDVEKTLIDCIYFRVHLSGKVLREFRKRINAKKLSSYLKKCPKALGKKIRSAVE